MKHLYAQLQTINITRGFKKLFILSIACFLLQPVFAQYAPPGNALNYTGSSYISVPTGSTTVSGNFTVEAWVMPSDPTSAMNIFSTRSAGGDQTFDMKLQGGSSIHGDIGDGSAWITTGADASFTYTVGTWYHITYAVSTSGYTIYANGVEVGTGTFTGTPLLFDNIHNVVTIGSSGASEYFNGNIDEVKVWNTTRSQAEVTADMLNVLTNAGAAAGLTAYYNFDQGTAGSDNTAITSLTDLGPNSLNGSFNSFGLTGSTGNFVNSFAGVIPVATAATNVTASGFTANWTAAVSGVTAAYVLDVATDANFTGIVTGYNGAAVTGTSANVTGLMGSTQYFYRIRTNPASDADNIYSTPAPATTTAAALTVTSFSPTIATPGEIVGITGTGFIGATAVSFGGTAAASFTVVNDDSIAAVVAAGSTGSVSVTTPGDNQSLAGFTFTLPTGTISGDTALCENFSSPSITFTGGYGTAPFTFTYTINGGANQFITTVSGNSVDLPVSTSTGGTFAYSLVSVQDNSGYSQSQNGTATVVVNQPTTSDSTAIVCSSALPVHWNGTYYYKQGTYHFLGTNAAGCDSVETLHLTINNSPSDTTTITVNVSALPYNWNGTNYSSGGIYTFIKSNASGCDSLHILRLTIQVPLPPTSFSYPTPNTYAKGTPITALSPTPVPAGTTTIFGSGISTPFAMATDAAGNVYVSDVANGVVDEIAPNGTTIATIGSGVLLYPYALAVDAGNNVYVVDIANGVVTKIAPGGAISTVGTGLIAPDGVAIDASGNVIIADASSDNVIRVTPGGVQDTILSGGLYAPAGVAADAAGNVYVLDQRGNVIKITPSGISPIPFPSLFSGVVCLATDSRGNVYTGDNVGFIKRVATNGSRNLITELSGAPGGITVDALGNIYVADTYNFVVDKISASGGPALRYAVSPALPAGVAIDKATGIISGTPTTASIQTTYTVTATNSKGSTNDSLAITITNTAGELFGYNSPNVFTKDTAISPLSPIFTPQPVPAGTITTLGTGFDQPFGVAVDLSGNIYVGNTNHNEVDKMSPDGATITPIGSGFYSPQGLVVDSFGNVYVADAGNNAIKKIASNGVTVTTIGSGFSSPTDVAMDTAGNLYVADYGHNAIKKITFNPGGGTTITRLGTGFRHPDGVAVDRAGNVYVADFGHGAVKEIAKVGGTITTLGPVFNGPNGVKVDSAGNVYVADYNASTIQVIAPGSATATNIGSGFYSPGAVAFDALGNIYVADTYNNAIKKIAGSAQVVTGFTIDNPLPAGLALDTSTGIISGTPTVTSPAATYNITALRGAGNLNAAVQIEVNSVSTTAVAVCSSALPYTWNGSDYNATGSYAFHSTGSTGEDSIAMLVLTVNPSPVATYSGKTEICYGRTDFTHTTATNGTAPYQYSIDGTNYQNSANFTVSPGTYSITVKDAAGCTATSNSLVITQPAASVSVNLSGNASCTGGSITATAAGGWGNYQYSLDNSTFQASNVLNIPSAGAYTVYVNDQQGCANKRSININPLSATLMTAHTVACYGGRSMIQAMAKNGTSPYTYSLDGINYQSSPNFNVQAGTYSVTVQDFVGCTVTTNSVTITQPPSALRMTITPTNDSCNGASNGSLTISPTGGYSFSYLYSLNGGSYQASNVFSGLQAGTFMVTVKDSDGCVNNKNATITQPVTPCGPVSSRKSELAGGLKVKVFPNPSVNDFNLVVEGGDSKKVVEIRVIDMLGRTVYHTRGSIFDMYKFGNTFAGGIYIAEVLNGENTQRLKLVKGH